ncbi:DDE-type integrase/transposase/recombinase [Austwickia sp. TVS 96-490-7B]|uniref:DDE-type integrase/transposase/recombinase n=1 Tax=Austwickia sp. TVS 96-490-7B TaxID=2830843 RepID=UPI00351CCEF2
MWTSDLTYLATGEVWLYLCAVRDRCSRSVIGYAFSEYLHTDVVETALRRAVRFRAHDLAAVAYALNTRPRKSLGWRTPAEAYNDQLISLQRAGVATTG